MGIKKRLAREIVTQLYDQKAASDAEEHFATVFQRRETPNEMPLVYLSDGFPDLRRLLTSAGMASSNSEAVRLINQGAVEIDGKKITSYKAQLQSGSIIKVGKRRFAKVIITDKLA